MLGVMHRIALLAALCSVPMLAAVDTVRHGGIPKPYWGTWAPSASGCKEPDQRIFLSGEDYVGPKASCRVVSVSETPSQTEPNYSARLECSPKGNREHSLNFFTTRCDRVANLIFETRSTRDADTIWWTRVGSEPTIRRQSRARGWCSSRTVGQEMSQLQRRLSSSLLSIVSESGRGTLPNRCRL